MKKIISCMLALMLTFSMFAFTGCGNNDVVDPDDQNTVEEQNGVDGDDTDTNTDNGTDTNTNDGKDMTDNDYDNNDAVDDTKDATDK